MILDKTKPGDLFILRNAGNLVPPHDAANDGEAATIEFAVAAHGVKENIICGHFHCGAIQDLLNPEQVASLPAVSSWLSHAEMTRRIMQENYGHLDDDHLLTATVEETTLVQLENLSTLPTGGSRLVRGDLQLHEWVYKIETGEVFAYHVENPQFVKLVEYNPHTDATARRRTTQVI